MAYDDIDNTVHWYDYLAYYAIRGAFWPFSLMPYSVLHKIGRAFGTLGYWLSGRYRKRVMNNLAIAKNLSLTEEQRRVVTKEVFQNLAITCLEFVRLARSKKDLSEIVVCENPEVLEEVKKQGQGAVLLSGHQANWEVCFFIALQSMNGIAVGRPIKNRRLYQWIVSIREMVGGEIIIPGQAISRGIRALRQGDFIGLVADQGLPESPYSYPFFGTRAWTSSAPALLAYRTNSPLVVVMTRRIGDKYHVHYSNPIYPNMDRSIKEEVPRMMDEAMVIFEDDIAQAPGQWLWLHNRWKQGHISHTISKRYRHDFIAVVLPPEYSGEYDSLLESLQQTYPRAFIDRIKSPLKDILRGRQWQYQMVIDFWDKPEIKKHFLALGAFKVLNADDLKKLLD